MHLRPVFALLLARRLESLPVLIGFARRHSQLLRLAWKHAVALETVMWTLDLSKVCGL
jgi:hypothetical protein